MTHIDVPDSTDVVIVGGGVMGTSTAYFLGTRSNLDVVLLEKDAIASGSTGDSSAILRHHYGDQRIYSMMAKWSHDFYRAFEEETGEAIAYAENPMVRFATAGTPGGEYATAGYEVLSDLDIPVTWLEAAELDAEYPMLALPDVDFGVRDDTAAYSDGADVAGGFARAAQNAGVTVVTDIAVTDIVERDGRVRAVETDRGPVETDAVVVTAGPWTPEIVASVGIDLPVTRSREQIVVLEPPESYLEQYASIVPTFAPAGGDWYAREDFNDGVLIATHHTGEAVEDPDTYKNAVDESVLLDLTDKVGSFVPELTAAGLRGNYSGIYSETPDHDFIIDQAGPAGLYIGAGFSGHGFKHAPAVGRILRDIVVDGETDFPDIDVEYFSLSRFEDGPEGHGLAEDAV